MIPLFIKTAKEGFINITHPEMTRFSITLNDGVTQVCDAISMAEGGEIFIPKIPSYRIVDVANAIGPSIKKNIVGLRAGEKIHEDMILESDSINTFQNQKSYIIIYSEMKNKESFIIRNSLSKVKDNFSYCSNKNNKFLTVEEIRSLIRSNLDKNFYHYESKKIPYGYHEITEKDILSVVEVLKKSALTQGEKVPELESSLSKKVQSEYAVAVNSATSALHLSCLAMGLQKGDYLWTTPISFVSSANCALFCGASVDFVDIDLDTGLLSAVESLKKKLIQAEKNNNLPKILVPVHLGGASCDMEAIYKLSKKYNFKILEDASHALGGSYNNYKVGSCKYSDVTVFSFHPVKMITTGEGGVITTNNLSIYSTLKLLRSHGVVKR